MKNEFSLTYHELNIIKISLNERHDKLNKILQNIENTEERKSISIEQKYIKIMLEKINYLALSRPTNIKENDKKVSLDKFKVTYPNEE